MNGVAHVTGSLEHVAVEHRDLRHRADQLRQIVRRATEQQDLPEALTELTLRLNGLRELMQRHFADEAAGGCLEEAVARLPRLAHRADFVERQHPDLLREVTELLEAVSLTNPSLETWREIGGSICRFAGRLLAHEAAEDQILQEGFNEDPALFGLDDRSTT